MAKKIWVAIIFTLMLAAAFAAMLILKNNSGRDTAAEPADSAVTIATTTEVWQTGELGGHECLAKFRVERGSELAAGKESLLVETFKSFRGGAFSGKIKDFQIGQNRQFSGLINQLMREGKISTYEHLYADVCLYRQDLLNPENGGNLNYYVEHYYCTNSCQTGKYEIRVDLDADGNFVGYRQTTDIY